MSAGVCLMRAVMCAGMLIARAGVGASTVLFRADFESAADRPRFAFGEKPDGMGFMGSSAPRIVHQAVEQRADAPSGTHVLRLVLEFGKDGYALPTFYLPAPLCVDAPLYLSGWVRILDKDPEASIRPYLLLWGEFPNDSNPLMGRLHTRPDFSPVADEEGLRVYKGYTMPTHLNRETDSGWVYLWSPDVNADMMAAAQRAPRKDGKLVRIEAEGKCVYAVTMHLNNVTAGRNLELLVDDIRLTRANPLPPLGAAEIRAAHAACRTILPEFRSLAVRDAAEADRRANAALADEVEVLGERAEADDAADASASFVSRLHDLKQRYWRLKVLDITGSLP
ncbi:MAG: hypothetical protein PHR35_00395 [Kiritimatiellae bacterium]|nr:hypothetical protein [Kiritimatiellia bacterium]